MTFHPRSAGLAIAVLVLAALAAAALVAVTGSYNVGADQQDSTLVGGMIAYVRDRSTETRGAAVQVPPLTDPKMIADGASDYDEMCTSCHLAPGLPENEMRPGLNPKPPVLALAPRGDAGEQFWIVKHGIRMTAMPAWGVTHSDAEIWNIVAFLQKLPALSPLQYRALVAGAGGHHEHAGHMDMDR